MALTRAFRESRGLGLWGVCTVWWNMQSARALSQGDHERAQVAARKLARFSTRSLGAFYLANSLFLLGRFAECRAELTAFLKSNPYHPDAVYLHAQALVMLGDREAAWRGLEELATVSRRLKTWLIMANLVQGQTDFQRFQSSLLQARAAGLAPAFHKDVSEYHALGALRCRSYGAARQIWRDALFHAMGERHFSVMKPAGKGGFSSKAAARSLADLAGVLGQAGIEMFLVSGTLLGCIREGKLLGHDKDVDVGIWEGVSRSDLLKALHSSGLFYVQASRSPEIVRVKHVNGIATDIFYHYCEANDYWHGGAKIKWHNSPFTLVECEFLGGRYLVPEDHDRYLTENYGDWRTPKIDFDSAYDTPNAEVINKDELAIHDFKMLLQSVLKQEPDGIQRRLHNLSQLGEDEFVARFNTLAEK